MKKPLYLAILLGALSLNSFAQSNKEKVVELFHLMNLDKLMDGMMDNMTSMIKQRSAGLKNEKGDKVYDEYMDFVMQETKALTKRMINEEMVPIYTRHFTNEEIQKYIEFYKTPEGRKLLAITPTIQKELINSIMAKDIPELQVKFQKKLKELQSDSNSKTDPSPEQTIYSK